MDNKPRANAMYSIPDDVDASTYRFIIVSAKRARQLQNGQRSLLPATNKKPTTLAMEEVRRGLVPYSDVTQEEALAKQEAALLLAAE
jgi:DNA-directed RNA polymerase subunit omega